MAAAARRSVFAGADHPGRRRCAHRRLGRPAALHATGAGVPVTPRQRCGDVWRRSGRFAQSRHCQRGRLGVAWQCSVRRDGRLCRHRGQCTGGEQGDRPRRLARSGRGDARNSCRRQEARGGEREPERGFARRDPQLRDCARPRYEGCHQACRRNHRLSAEGHRGPPADDRPRAANAEPERLLSARLYRHR